MYLSVVCIRKWYIVCLVLISIHTYFLFPQFYYVTIFSIWYQISICFLPIILCYVVLKFFYIGNQITKERKHFFFQILYVNVTISFYSSKKGDWNLTILSLKCVLQKFNVTLIFSFLFVKWNIFQRKTFLVVL